MSLDANEDAIVGALKQSLVCIFFLNSNFQLYCWVVVLPFLFPYEINLVAFTVKRKRKNELNVFLLLLLLALTIFHLFSLSITYVMEGFP